MGKKRLVALGLTFLLLLTACGKGGEVTPEPPTVPETTPMQPVTPTPTYDGPVNPLTGQPIGEEWVNKRPVAIMLNNLREALPQMGQSQADIIYECIAEGGITRMLGVYQTTEGVGRIGSIRSSRPYYLELALGHDAVYIHAGGSEDAYAKIKQWGVTALDAVRGPYLGNSPNSNLMWRDPDRRKNYSLEHTVVTTGDNIIEKFATYNFRQEHEEGYRYDMSFTEDGTPSGGTAVEKLTIPYSNYKTGVFTYDPETRRYLVEEYGKPYMDGETDQQVGVTNVVILKANYRNTGDKYAHMTVDLSSGGSGYFACGGQMVEITWEKDAPDGQLHYYTKSGAPLVFGQGNTYVNIVPLDCALTAE